MKKLVLVGLLLVSWVWGKSIEQVQNEWMQRITAKLQEAAGVQQSEEVVRIMPHCQLGDKGACERIILMGIKQCDNGSAAMCGEYAYSLANGDPIGIKADLKKAQIYADKACALDIDFCVRAVQVFANKDDNLAVNYAKKACEKGELAGCVMAVEFYTSVRNDKMKAKYYTDKLCKGGVSEACGK